jgi:hypothetical protein
MKTTERIKNASTIPQWRAMAGLLPRRDQPDTKIMKTRDQIRNEPAIFGTGGDAAIASGSLPTGWTGNLNGLTVSNGDSIVLAGTHDITLTSGTLLAYKLAPTPPVAATPAVS